MEKVKTEKISLKTIAERLCVSKTLVSMVINNKGDANGISKETQKRVWAVAKQLNYKPNFLARGLRLGKTYTIGLIVSDISNPFYSRIARIMEDEAATNGYTLFICSTDESPENETKMIKMLTDRQVDGLIISSSQSNIKEYNLLRLQEIPFIFIDRYFTEIDASSIIVNGFDSSYNAINHLINNGYKRIASFAITPVYISSIRQRIEGYLKAIKENNFNYTSDLLVEIDYENIKDNVKKKIIELVNNEEPIDAIFAVNNKVCIACLESLKELEIKIPEQIAILSFDDIDVFKLTTPTITAISQPIEDISKNAFQILMNEIDSKNTVEYKQVILNPELIVRDSTTSKSTK